jgi:hypothetical protein
VSNAHSLRVHRRCQPAPSGADQHVAPSRVAILSSCQRTFRERA